LYLPKLSDLPNLLNQLQKLFTILFLPNVGQFLHLGRALIIATIGWAVVGMAEKILKEI
jgi:hypothetical protein